MPGAGADAVPPAPLSEDDLRALLTPEQALRLQALQKEASQLGGSLELSTLLQRLQQEDGGEGEPPGRGA